MYTLFFLVLKTPGIQIKQCLRKQDVCFFQLKTVNGRLTQFKFLSISCKTFLTNYCRNTRMMLFWTYCSLNLCIHLYINTIKQQLNHVRALVHFRCNQTCVTKSAKVWTVGENTEKTRGPDVMFFFRKRVKNVQLQKKRKFTRKPVKPCILHFISGDPAGRKFQFFSSSCYFFTVYFWNTVKNWKITEKERKFTRKTMETIYYTVYPNIL